MTLCNFTKRLSTLLVFVSLSLNFLSCNIGSDSVKEASENIADISPGLSKVTKVVDGDTFWVNDRGVRIKIRLIGIDSPESRNAFKKRVGYFGKEAKVYLNNLLMDKLVRLEYDVDRTDQYGRTLAYVYLQDETFVNADLVRKGYAVIMTVPPNVKFAEEFVKLQQDARENRRGLWGLGD